MNRVLHRAFNQSAFVAVRTVGKRLEPHIDAHVGGQCQNLVGIGRCHGHQGAVGRKVAYRSHHRCQGCAVYCHFVVERAVGFDVFDGCAVGAADAVQRSDLIHQQGLEFLRRKLHVTPAEAQQIRIAGVRADGDLLGNRGSDGAVHGQRV